jgi:hypothetical protein
VFDSPGFSWAALKDDVLVFQAAKWHCVSHELLILHPVLCKVVGFVRDPHKERYVP